MFFLNSVCVLIVPELKLKYLMMEHILKIFDDENIGSKGTHTHTDFRRSFR